MVVVACVVGVFVMFVFSLSESKQLRGVEQKLAGAIALHLDSSGECTGSNNRSILWWWCLDHKICV